MTMFYKHDGGVALIIALVFLCIFGTLLAGFSSMTNLNAQISNNQRNSNCALGSAQSGLDVVRYLFSDITVSALVEPYNRLNAVATRLEDNLDNAGMTNIATAFDGSTITMESVALDSQTNQGFAAEIQQISDDTIQVRISGFRGEITRTILAEFDFTTSRSPVFDFGVATRGPLSMWGNAKLRGLNFDAEANIYIESSNDDQALTMSGNSEVTGDVSIANNDAYAVITGNSEIAGDTGQDAVDNHVTFGVDTSILPVPDITSFQQYVQNIVDEDTQTTGNKTFQNIKILSGTNPTFTGNINLDGIIYVESPNIVSFSGNIVIRGLIVADGDSEFPYATDSISFTGNLSTYDCSYLPAGEDFDGLRDLSYSFLLAPGFRITFGGNFSTIGGVIAGSGIAFSGNAGGTINGTLINYSDDPMLLGGNPTLYFSLPEEGIIPAGFTQDKELRFNPESYSEVSM